MKSKAETQKVCLACKKGFIAKSSDTKYCSNNCVKFALSKKSIVELGKYEKIQKRDQPDVLQIKIIQTKEFLSIKEACVLIGVSRMSLYRYMTIGLIEPVRIGSRVIIKRESIDNLINM